MTTCRNQTISKVHSAWPHAEIRPSQKYIVHDHMQKSDHLKSTYYMTTCRNQTISKVHSTWPHAEIRPSQKFIVHDHMQKSDHLKSVWLFSNMFSLLTSNCTCILYLIKHKLKAIHSVTYLSFNLSRYLHLMQKMQHCCTLCPFQYELQHLFQNVAHP